MKILNQNFLILVNKKRNKLYKTIIKIFLFLSPIIMFSQNNFYIGLGGISSFGNTIKNDKEFNSKKIIDFGVYIGNQFIISNQFKFKLECFYLNNQLVLARKNSGDYESSRRFEMHQNVGFLIKPGYYINKHSFYFSIGVLGVYIFDKEEYTGRQLDRFDESYSLGLEYSHNVSEKVSFSFGR